MPPKKAKKISLNEFLGDSALGSWADEMDSLPNAPAARNEDDQGRPGDRYGRRDDYLSTRPDRAAAPPRDDIPLPTNPPYTAFIGNLAFDLTETELEEFFAPLKAKSVKIIRDREDKPKGFGYVEFEDLDGLKEAISKSGSTFSGRTIRVSVAEPPKERSGFGDRGGGGGVEDDSKFDNPWRREGPLPDHPRDSRRRYDGPSSGDRERLPSVAEGASEWRSSRPSRPAVPDEFAPPRRRSGFSTPEGQSGSVDQAETWIRGSKFAPAPGAPEERFGSLRGKGDMGPPKDSHADEVDWRARKSSISPASSTPPTPQLSRRKLELLPRSGTPSAAQSPLSSPKMGPTPTSSNARASPFGAARPVDVANKDKEITERLEKERETVKERVSMSRTNSRQASERVPLTSTPPSAGANAPAGSANMASPKTAPRSLAPTVRPTLSFANAAAAKREEVPTKQEKENDQVDKVAEKIAEVEV
ncbi:putative RNA-binding protein sce3 [Termitomyces sp. T112]|nr:putative RNA-binding protein sce3 [Termitomyces sp. T112]KAH0584950.1 hypothetical protein H2248_008222 [Termitomyces sp. 'cryptogamus']